MNITEEELGRLIELSSIKNVLSVGYGNGQLLDVPENSWAFDEINRIRSEQ